MAAASTLPTLPSSPKGFQVVPSEPRMATALEQIQELCFPTLAPDERITAEHYRAQMTVFPEGQLAVLSKTGEVVACSTDFICNVDLERYEHRYIDIVANNYLSNHDPQGEWLYGADIGVHPEYRRLGLSSLLYQARHNLVRHYNLKGHVVGGMLKGYGKHKDEMSVEDYVERVVAGDIFDPTVSIQLKRGFRLHGIIQDYVEDSSSHNKAALLIWRNPDYQEVST